jgi:hypothetical protein
LTSRWDIVGMIEEDIRTMVTMVDTMGMLEHLQVGNHLVEDTLQHQLGSLLGTEEASQQ